jgi:2-dehydro-3-deoxyphosphogluconate aldolase / (4S)-4-hydroxy-2-oxoglutarate aldolase
MRMGYSDLFEDSLGILPVMAILRGFGERTVELCEIAWDVGIRLVEIPIQDDMAVAALKDAAAAAGRRGGIVGAGTVTTVQRVYEARAAGAGFTVAPDFDADVADASVKAGMPYLPGVATPSEVKRALASGFTWLKAFPASDLGAGWARSLHGPFPEARFVATGGVSLGNAQAFLDGGCAAVSLGSALSDPRQVERLPEFIETVTGTARL